MKNEILVYQNIIDADEFCIAPYKDKFPGFKLVTWQVSPVKEGQTEGEEDVLSPTLLALNAVYEPISC